MTDNHLRVQAIAKAIATACGCPYTLALRDRLVRMSRGRLWVHLRRARPARLRLPLGLGARPVLFKCLAGDQTLFELDDVREPPREHRLTHGGGGQAEFMGGIVHRVKFWFRVVHEGIITAEADRSQVQTRENCFVGVLNYNNTTLE